MTYAAGQLERIYEYLPREPEWLLLGGPADSNEANTAREKWSDVKVIGVEPNPKAVEWQLGGKWPKDCPLIEAALWSENGTTAFTPRKNTLRHGTTQQALMKERHSVSQVRTVTLDSLDTEYGPFTDAILWLDIEGSEYQALLGARKLLERDAIILINVEMVYSIDEVMEGIPELMDRYGFTLAHDTGPSHHHCERIYVK